MIADTGVVVYPVLGVHPAEISRLTDRMSLEEAAGVMKGGLDCAAQYGTGRKSSRTEERETSL